MIGVDYPVTLVELNKIMAEDGLSVEIRGKSIVIIRDVGDGSFFERSWSRHPITDEDVRCLAAYVLNKYEGRDTMNIFKVKGLFEYLSAEMITNGKANLTIRAATVNEIGSARGKSDKLILYFNETDKGLVMNIGNMRKISKVLGPETDNWIGATLQLSVLQEKVQGELRPVMRITNVTRPPKKGATQAPQGNEEPEPPQIDPQAEPQAEPEGAAE